METLNVSSRGNTIWGNTHVGAAAPAVHRGKLDPGQNLRLEVTDRHSIDFPHDRPIDSLRLLF